MALKVDVLKEREIYCLQACLCVFQPGNFTGRGSEGVNYYYLFVCCAALCLSHSEAWVGAEIKLPAVENRG